MFDKVRFNQFLIDSNVIGFFDKPVILKSGRQSYWYANCRNLSNTFEMLDKTADFVIEFIDENITGDGVEFDYVYGVPEGASKLAIIVSYKLGMKLNNKNQKIVMGRGQPKPHGVPKDKYFIGDVNEGDRVLVIEDVTTTAGSLLTTIKQLKEAKVNVVGALSLVNRMEKRDDGKSVEAALNELGVPYFPLGNAFNLLPLAKEKYNPSSEILQHIESGFRMYGVKEFKF